MHQSALSMTPYLCSCLPLPDRELNFKAQNIQSASEISQKLTT